MTLMPKPEQIIEGIIENDYDFYSVIAIEDKKYIDNLTAEKLGEKLFEDLRLERKYSLNWLSFFYKVSYCIRNNLITFKKKRDLLQFNSKYIYSSDKTIQTKFYKKYLVSKPIEITQEGKEWLNTIRLTKSSERLEKLTKALLVLTALLSVFTIVSIIVRF
ncbi:MAG: hypothetical protein M1348_01580 [Candidatus Parvarchaeota archaeon]|nr:hypothetical protein [Candidatus Parvarchaeota archaeon]